MLKYTVLTCGVTQALFAGLGKDGLKQDRLGKDGREQDRLRKEGRGKDRLWHLRTRRKEDILQF